MNTTKAFGKADMKFLEKVGENADLASDKLLALLEEQFTRLTMTPQPIPVGVQHTNNTPQIRR